MIIRTDKAIDIRLIAIGFVALVVGTMVYLTDRPPKTAYFIRVLFRNLSFYSGSPSHFGYIGYNLPAFIHVFSFSLFSAGVNRKAREWKLINCFSWFLLNTIFKIGQKFPVEAVRCIPKWFNKIPFLENTGNFFRYGTFDLWDIVAFAIGALAAFICLTLLEERVDGGAAIETE